ncbi:MAG: glycosyltransferase family 39 protein [Candidatus Krumholzibacteria bacterium]|nr:glycosyltransferase family 39 protein [Candidatus Krumholzibacteria bacterium]MDH4338186.1 glycosyltransferase family 39 protein [Candidatus Krumholzibacteria bacterium]MDH5269825.1 glycosyltransferase family 39 protein [Candidatus Krumholzibacteria bacterium]
MALHLTAGLNYGIFRDELYYWDCANHLAWGYVDHPPLSIAVLAGWKVVFGDSLFSLRVIPALAGGALVFVVAALARRMGASRFGVNLAALITLAVPCYLGITGIYSMNAFDLLFWAAGYLLVLRLIEAPRTGTWVALGVCVGIGMLNKISVSVFVVALLAGALVTPQRRWLRTRGPYLAGAIAALIFLPHVLWQISNGWPTREFIENAQRYKITALSPPGFLAGVMMEMSPPLAPLHLVGIAALFFLPSLRRFRMLGWMVVAAIAFFMLQRSKPYYVDAVFPAVIAATGVAVGVAAGRLRWLRPVVVVFVAACMLVTTPFAVPVLPVETFIAYMHKTGGGGSSGENRETAELPQFYADRFGWQELAEQVAETFRGLPDEDRADCLIWGRNYGNAGALNYYGRALGLPTAVSTHNNYHLWGPGRNSARVVITVGIGPEDLGDAFEEYVEAGSTHARYAMPDETGVGIWVCRGIRLPLEEVWRLGKAYR